MVGPASFCIDSDGNVPKLKRSCAQRKHPLELRKSSQGVSQHCTPCLAGSAPLQYETWPVWRVLQGQFGLLPNRITQAASVALANIVFVFSAQTLFCRPPNASTYGSVVGTYENEGLGLLGCLQPRPPASSQHGSTGKAACQAFTYSDLCEHGSTSGGPLPTITICSQGLCV